MLSRLPLPASGRLRAALAGLAGVCVLVPLTVAVHAGAAAAAPGWTVDLAQAGENEVNVDHTGGLTLADPSFRPGADPDARGYAMTELAAHPIGRTTGTVAVDLSAAAPAGAAVTVEIRGQLAGGGFTEWRAGADGTIASPAPRRPCGACG
jgi:hypothetical protein